MNEAVASCRLDGETVPVWPEIRVVNVTASNMRKLGLTAADVCYVGRAGRFHKWPHHPLANPFKPGDIKYRHWGTEANKREACLADYRQWLKGMGLKTLNDALDALWEACDHGAKPLGCWCHPEPCHADVLAAELHKRFVEGKK